MKPTALGMWMFQDEAAPVVQGRRMLAKLPDGRWYETLTPSDFSPVMVVRFNRVHAVAYELQGTKDPEESERLEASLRLMAQMICPSITEETREALPVYTARLLLHSFFDQQKKAKSPAGADPETGIVPRIRWEELVPELQRFYTAGDPLGWLHLPMSSLETFASNVGRLRAKESLPTLHRNLGRCSGHTKPAEARRIVRQWKQDAQGRPAYRVRDDATGIYDAGHDYRAADAGSSTAREGDNGW